jgi:hypothetical protein
MAEFPFAPRGIPEISHPKPPPIPVQFVAKSSVANILGPPPAGAPPNVPEELNVFRYDSTEVTDANAEWCSLLNTGVKKLAILLGPEIRHNIEGYREGHTYNVEEMDTLIDVSRAMIAAARKCKEIRWKFLDQIFELLESRKAVFGTCNWRFYFSERVRVLRPIRGRNSFSLARPDQKHCYCPARRH